MDNFTIFTWALTAVTIAGTYLNSKQNKYGFLVWGLCNMLWLGVDFTRGIYAQAALYVVFIGFNIYGWKQWGKKDFDIVRYQSDNIDDLIVKLEKHKLNFNDTRGLVEILKRLPKF